MPVSPASAARNHATRAPITSQRRLWLFRITALMLLPLALVVMELALRIAGYGHPTSFFVPAEIKGEACLVENDRFGLRFFPSGLLRSPTPVVMRTHKP